MADNNFANVMESLFKGMDSFLSAKTVVGEPTQVGENIIIPLVDVSFGVGAGASVKDHKNTGAGGMSGKMSPSAVLIIRPDGTTRLVNVKSQDNITKVLDMIPDVVDHFKHKKDNDVTDDEAVDVAFGEES
ncbi:MAG: GerW family sporulation protein [Lachnospiraceae bacterium]